ncbi:hypothetical protein [Myceligenerans pegani]|uniref:Uncharacterized protein n=1 Tax=Myceligenerans pegani TaxID=2776917 RepID=A0ABR9N1J9_9MICO|nr:hypothetical protein [Myceligenerans sp. TRM 65318]MBE1877535.1 hypothetical protein [Myceligenerans sp. TRM 65318]MBE3019806.1 hypothetical protein [Myceligenerans sp. TRM 65318]
MSKEPTPELHHDDVTMELLRDTAEVHAVRGEVKPVIDALVAALTQDPLGNDDTAHRIADALENPRTRSARAARARLSRDLSNGLPDEVRTR